MHSDPIIDIVNQLPKEELAAMAEALVNPPKVKEFRTMEQLVSHFFPREGSPRTRPRGKARERGSKALDEALARLGRSVQLR